MTRGGWVVGLVCLALQGAAVWAALPLAPAPAYRDEVLLDQADNVVGRRDEIRGADERAVLSVLEFHVPVEQTEVTMSSRLSKDEADRFFVIENGARKFLRVWIPENNVKLKETITKLKRLFGEPLRPFAASRLQGKATYHVWQDGASDEQAFRLKVPYKGVGSSGEKVVHNSYAVGARAVMVSDILAGIQERKPIPGVDYYREIFVANLTVPGLPYNFLIRQPPQAAYRRSESQGFLPLHGLLGSTALDRLALAKGLTPVQWIMQEYLPKLASTMAKLNFGWGAWLEAHTQNLSVLVNYETGEIEVLYFKDLADLMLSPFYQATAGVLPAYRDVPDARLNEEWISNNGQAEFAGPFAYYYLWQAVTSWSGEQKLRAQSVATFLKAYLRETRGVMLKTEFETYLKMMEKGRDPVLVYQFSPYNRILEDDASGSAAAFLMIMESAAWWKTGVNRALATYPMLPGLAIDKEPHKKLVRLAKKYLARGHLNWAFANARQIHTRDVIAKTKMTAIPVENGILYGTSAPYFYGVIYAMSDEDREFVNAQARAIGTLKDSTPALACAAAATGVN